MSVSLPSNPSKKVVAPWLWQFQAPKAGGGTRPMAELLEHFLTLRGIYTANQTHDLNLALHYRSAGSQQSLPAFAADQSGKSIPAVAARAPAFDFSSSNQKSSVAVGTGNFIKGLMDPFQPVVPPTNMRSKENQIQNVMDAARAALARESQGRNSQAKLAEEAMKQARSLVVKNFGDLNQVWSALLAKYTDLVNRAFDINVIKLAGINDVAIPYSGKQTDPLISYDSLDPKHSLYDLAKNTKTEIPAGTDLREILGGATVPGLASGFALAEFVLLQDLSDSITIGGLDTRVTWGGNPATIAFDQHFLGAISGTLINSHWAVAHAACMLELIDRLKEKGMWKNTLVNTSSEMIRSPLAAGYGSDHGSTMHFNLFSGCIDGPIILGNIASEGVIARAGARYPGTWGEAGNQPEIGGEIKIEHAHNTIATILGLAGSSHKFIPARQSLVTIGSDGMVKPAIALGKIVA
ncbi:MAG: DUF1501 domain-containing protein [Proteobacteria bacterium]|nr:DUF1501 domain-containing protein [Pseudomonadota bacterium]NDD04143.1 DUF1501 domain-containing protein [Pseudomonadota bacterium]